MNDSKLESSQLPRRSGGLKFLIAFLIAWGLLMALGTYQTQASTDIRRPLIVVAIMGLFLGVWMIALVRQKR